MRVLITGGGGFLGQKLARKLAASGQLRGQPISSLTLMDVVEPAAPNAGFDVACLACDIADDAMVRALFAGHGPFDVIYHLAAVVSGAAEADFDLGMRVNLFGTLHLFEAARAAGNCPVVVYASSIAAHGGEEPEVIVDGVELNPQTSYGSQKVIGELLLNDMSRKGFMDGRGLRLPTVSIRPGKANAAASSFMSSIFRDTMQGEASNCPVGRDFLIFHTAPRTIVENLIIAAELEAEVFGYNRCLNLPGRSDTVAEMVNAMTRVFGPEAEARITWDSDPVIEEIVHGWRNRVISDKALRLGFVQDRSFEDTVHWFLEDDIVGRA
ncbi:SDR family oxidoreductase [Alisedimentitalea sp. MJ-SS2]|uniref:D-erythronate dehydrogenase n=1 Tax=Aliisedimentitalea sp. MJ-SS2 TaxID=3049795 RepID=UPI002905F810|nr:D-erythronate dehydrogenase [Alisedimentitalea sp. MJ-SS2]MDU8927060.1 SDR family oxidoreductase [Alisedimentitalea sp. MJ-SS2]